MLTEKDCCDYDTSRSLKELGFRCGLGEYACCIYDEAWHDQVDQPLLYEVQKWLREEKKIEIVIFGDNYIGGPYHVDIYAESGPIYLDRGNGHSFYESALLEGIKEAIKLLKEEK